MVPAGVDADIIDDVQDLPEEYFSDDCEKLTSILSTKYATLFKKNNIDVEGFKHLDLVEKFQLIEELQRREREKRHKTFATQKDKGDLLGFSKSQISFFVGQATEKRDHFQWLVAKTRQLSEQSKSGSDTEPVQLQSKDELAKAFLPKSVQSAIATQHAKDPRVKRQKRLTKL